MAAIAKPLNDLTALDIVAALDGGGLTVEALVGACLDRIADREPVVGAWAHLDREGALAAARRLDRGPRRGALHGVPFGAKDIMDTADMPTGYGSPIHAGARPPADASCVALPRAAGAVLLGKTVTTEFANFTPGKTANPHDPARTPGGSSSGSAAAVADRMVPLALGTQTTQSVIRPAAFCGVHGYCPTQGDFRMSGVREAAGSFDRIGLIARSLGDIALLRAVLLRQAPEPLAPAASPPRLGLCRTELWDRLDPALQTALEGAAGRLSAAGADLREVALPDGFAVLSQAHRRVSSFEFVRNFAHEIEHHWEAISPQLRAGRIADGLATGFDAYREARATLAACRARLPALFEDVDLLLAPSALGEAPPGLDATGDAALGALFTPLYLPCLTLPAFTGPNGLPMGLQLLSAPDRDEALLAGAAWVEAALR